MITRKTFLLSLFALSVSGCVYSDFFDGLFGSSDNYIPTLLTNNKFHRLYSGFESDFYEEDGTIIFEKNMPGMKREDITIEVIENKHLKISGTRKSSAKKENAHYFRQEIKSGNFQEIISLPYPVDADNVGAELKDGVLKVILPIKQEKKSDIKKIEILDEK